MASGQLWTSTLSAGGTGTTTYVVPNTTYSVFNVSFTNTSTTTAAQIRLYIGASTGASPVPSEAIEYGTTIAPGGVFERTGLVLSSTGSAKNVVCYASTATVNVNIYGIETSTS